MGKLIEKPIKPSDQFPCVEDTKLRMTLIALADKYSEKTRDLIYRTYNDPELASIYRAIRNSGVYQHGGKSKVHRQIVMFPNGYVDDFVNTVMTALKGPDWMRNKRNFRHKLIRPWWTVNTI